MGSNKCVPGFEKKHLTDSNNPIASSDAAATTTHLSLIDVNECNIEIAFSKPLSQLVHSLCEHSKFPSLDIFTLPIMSN